MPERKAVDHVTSVREIRRRKTVIQSTAQIIRGMKLIATVRLTKDRARAEGFRPYFEELRGMGAMVLEEREWPEERKGPAGIVAFTSNRGLAGGYSQQIVRMIAGDGRFLPGTAVVYAVGKRGRDSLAAMGYEIRGDYSEAGERPDGVFAEKLAGRLLEDYEAGEIGEIYLAYTVFRNAVVQEPRLIRVLPAETEDGRKAENGLEAEDGRKAENSLEAENGRKAESGLESENSLGRESGPAAMREETVGAGRAGTGEMEYEPDREQLRERMLPWYMGGMIYGACLEAAASENGARMRAMDSAAGNGKKLLEELELQYNRARQDTITRELTEIAAGAGEIMEHEEG